MTKKAKKLGVKTNKTAVFDEEHVEVKKDEKVDTQEVEESAEVSSSTDDSSEELSQICETLDKLSLDLLILMQNQIQHKLNIEKAMTDGELHLSKSRYIMGHKNVSTLQLPTENSVDIIPSVTLEEKSDDIATFSKPRLDLNVENFTKPDTDNETEKNIQDPVKWFGVLVPRDLRSAQNKFKDALSWVVDCANNQIKLQQTCVKIKQLTQLKHELRKANNV